MASHCVASSADSARFSVVALFNTARMAATCCALRARISCRVIAISPGCVGTVPDKQPMQRRRAVKRIGPRFNAARWRHKARIGPHRQVRKLCGMLARCWHTEKGHPEKVAEYRKSEGEG